MNECEHITCPGETMEGLFFPTTESNTRVCDEKGVWSETMEGECSCPAEVVHHSDGNVYLMEESGERDVRREHDGLRVAVVEYYTAGDLGSAASTSMCKHVQAHSVSGGAAERLHVAGDEQFDGGASAM